MRNRLILCAVLTTLTSIAFADMPTTAPADEITRVIHGEKPDGKPDNKDDRPLVQIALLLDTSNSMDGLINQARTQLWTIVNEIGHAKRDGKTPRLQVALIEYGNDGLPSGEGYIRTVLTFTDNLDDVSEKLFALTTNGGSEFCGQAIGQATNTLAWAGDASAYKVIFIAGNEPFSQGSVDYKSTCAQAIGRGIVVNTIHCGERAEGIEGGWADGAKRGEGYFTNIDQNKDVHVIRCPQDEQIEKLSVEINVTYVPYGRHGAEAQKRQSAQDDNAAANATAGSSVQRAASKAGANYENSTWDLVDAVNNGKVDLAKADDNDLPDTMKGMTPEQRKAFIESQTKKREDLRSQINKLVAERETFVADQQKNEAADGTKTLDAAVTESLREQLKARHYETK